MPTGQGLSDLFSHLETTCSILIFFEMDVLLTLIDLY